MARPAGVKAGSFRTEVERMADAAFVRLNDRLFDHALPRPIRIRVKALEAAWGRCVAQLDPVSGDPVVHSIDIHPSLFRSDPHAAPNERALDIVLAHEMVHGWQWLVDGPDRIDRGLMPLMSHGPSFWRWRPRFEAEGLLLRRGYSRADLFGPCGRRGTRLYAAPRCGRAIPEFEGHFQKG